MGVVRHSSTVARSRDEVFAYIDDYVNVTDYMFGVSKFDPRTEITQGVGSVFEVELKAGPKTLTSTVETKGWIQDEYIALEAIEGFVANTTWRFSDADGGGTRLDAEFEYILPGGLAGRALGAIMEPFAAQAIRQTEHNLRKHLG